MRYHISVKLLFSKIPLGNFLDILRMRNVKKSFGDKEILKGLQLSVPSHSIYGFVGKNSIRTVPRELRHRISAGRSGILFLYDSFRIPFLLRRNHRLFEALAESFAENGISYKEITVDAMTSWAQFYKNVPMGLLVFILLESSIFTKEYSQNTLLLTLAKGFRRYKAAASKGVTILLLWSLYYWICFGITYGYNDFFRDNSIACNLWFS